MATNPYSLKNMYIYGGSVLTIGSFLLGLMVTNDPGEALIYMIENYIIWLLPLQWPLNEMILADTISEFFVSHVITISVGLGCATIKYWMNAP